MEDTRVLEDSTPVTDPDVIERLVLQELHQNGCITDSVVFARTHRIQHKDLVSELNSLAAHELVALKNILIQTTELTEEGEEVLVHGSPEFRLWALVGENGVLKVEAEVRAPPIAT